MQLLTDALVAVLSGYLALVGGLASMIDSNLVSEQSPTQTTIEELSAIESNFGSSLPDILIKNAAYQSAAIIDGVSDRGEAENVIDALVNIYCTYSTDTETRRTTGSGFFINSAGVIMTNAHVAQFLLLADTQGGATKCQIRAGDPAVALYEAELLYISPAWVEEHAHLIDSENPKGTGERDYALLYTTNGLDNSPLPGRFPFLPLATEPLNKNLIGSKVTVAGYPAETFFATGIDELIPAVAATTLSDMFTFGSNQADVISIDESVAGEHGVSGGPVIDSDGRVIGLVSTKGSQDEGVSSLRALTVAYIDRSMREESTFGIYETASGQLAFRAQLFMETIVPFLRRILESELAS